MGWGVCNVWTALAEQDVATTRCLKEKELQNAKDALHHLEAELERMTFQFAELLNVLQALDQWHPVSQFVTLATIP